ncbi:MAG TPA: peptidoglycan editing factor PgeF [Rubrivivax sp.]|nr:peptidoglycan editing factor PgeF [Rubrivivax sp.]
MPSDPPALADAELLRPPWPADARVGALMSTRTGGVSAGPWHSLNLGLAVGDDAAAVAENRRRFVQRLGARPVWLHQVHGCSVVRATPALLDAPPTADAAWTDEPGIACVVQVADCLPLLLAAPEGRAVAAAHAGWRGLAGGVVEAALAALCSAARCAPGEVWAWLGPCIGPRRFEVGADVLRAFAQTPEAADARRFVPAPPAHGTPRWWADLPQLARDRLKHGGVQRISGGEHCTVEQRSRFFSYRRDGVTGRMAAAVWIRR